MKVLFSVLGSVRSHRSSVQALTLSHFRYYSDQDGKKLKTLLRMRLAMRLFSFFCSLLLFYFIFLVHCFHYNYIYVYPSPAIPVHLSTYSYELYMVQSRGHFRKFLCSILNRSRFPFRVNSIYFALPPVCFGEPRSLISGKYSNCCTQWGQKPLETVTAKVNITWNALRRREVTGDEDGITIVNGYTL